MRRFRELSLCLGYFGWLCDGGTVLGGGWNRLVGGHDGLL